MVDERDRSQTLVRGPDAKRGPLKFMTLVRGTLKKITNFLVKIEFTCFSMGLTHNFHEKKGALNFLSLKWGAKKFSRYFFFFFCIKPTNKCL